jgi:hypothetical protein
MFGGIFGLNGSNFNLTLGLITVTLLQNDVDAKMTNLCLLGWLIGDGLVCL